MFTFAVEDIEEVIDTSLYAVQWKGAKLHSLDEMATQLKDAEWLYEYFEKNEKKLVYFGRPSIDQAVLDTRRAANTMLEQLSHYSKNGEKGKSPDLDSLFKPLHKPEFYHVPGYHTDFKAKGNVRAPWIRVYAVRCDINLYVITGFGIKLVRKMDEDPFLEREKHKLQIATEYLKGEGFL